MSNYNVPLDLETKNSLSLIISRIKENSTILEFGPANGRLTRHLKEQMNCKVYCVELDEKSAKDAEPYAEKMLVDSIENYTWCKEFSETKFDYIIFADVLEHLYSPKQVLEKSKLFLKDKGSILLSIPNVAHNAVIMDLLQGKFTYRSTGLLDETHIRFFTKTTLDEMIDEVGFFSVYKTATFVPPRETEFAYSYSEFDTSISKYLEKLPNGEVYQFIYELSI